MPSVPPVRSSHSARLPLALLAASLLGSTSVLAQDLSKDLSSKELALKRVMLSSGGMGYYEYEAEVEGDAKLKLTVGLDQVDDVLKSLVVYDDKGGLGGLDLPSREPLAQTFRSLPFGPADLQSGEALLNALRGAEVSLGGTRSLSGRVIGVAPEQQSSANGTVVSQRHRVTLMSDKGLQQFILEEAEDLRFTDPVLQGQIARALAALASNHARDARTLELSSSGKEKRKVRVAYIVEAPLWKTSYRIVLPSDPAATKAAVQGWATMENLSGQNWKDVDLTLVSGQPVTFRQALYQSYKVQRPEAPVEVMGRLLPNADEGGVEEQANRLSNAPRDQVRFDLAYAAPKERNTKLRAFRAMAGNSGAIAAGEPADDLRNDGDAASKAPMGSAEVAKPLQMAASQASITAQEGLTQVVFHISAPVSVVDGRTLSVPIIDAQMPVERLSLYEPEIDARHPLSTVKLTDDGKTGLPPGIVTIFEQGENGVAYVGDSRLSALPANDSRLLSYALDQRVTIERSVKDATQSTRAAIAKGILRYDSVQRQATTYKVKATEPRNLVVEETKFSGWALTDPAMKGVTDTGNALRIPFAVKAGDGQSFTTVQEKTQEQQLVLDGADSDALIAFSQPGGFDDKTREALLHIVELQGLVAKADKAKEDLDAEKEAIGTEQERIRQNLPVVPKGSDMQKRYLAKLNDQETALEKLSLRLKDAEKAQSDAKQAVEDYISRLK